MGNDRSFRYDTAKTKDFPLIMKSRHSVRKYLDKQIPGDIRSILDSYADELNAASGLNIQILYDEPECFGSFDEAYAEFDRIEEALFLAGGSDHTLPAQDAAAFLGEKPGLKNRRHACETGIVPGRIDQLLRRDVREALQAALKHFDRRYPGFCREGKLIGVESCVSSPLRFERTEKGESSSMHGLFPAGEGVGGAGGILSGAADGLRCALGILE